MLQFLGTSEPAATHDLSRLQQVFEQFIHWCVSAGGHVVGAIIIFVIGRFLISFINRLVAKLMLKRGVDASIQSFVKSLVNILLTVLLIVAVVGKLGVDTTSFAALLASAGVAVGMALSGNLQNFAGGLIVLLLRPYRVGDLIESQGVTGVVQEIQIFHTILLTADRRRVYVPNGSLSSGTVINYSREETRRLEWTVGVEYGTDVDRVCRLLLQLAEADKRILSDPAPFAALGALDASSVNVILRAHVSAADYWDVFFDMNRTIYETFNREGISFPFPQLTVHQASR